MTAPPLPLDPQLVGRLMAATNGEQYRHDGGNIEPLKLAAKKRAADLVNPKLAPGSRILDVGAEPFYWRFFGQHQLTAANLPDLDMHRLGFTEEFQAVLAMHVLEHSPFPLYVLGLLHRALVPGGWLYVAVPHPSERICSGFGHITVMPPVMWRRLLVLAGFQIAHTEAGKMGARADWVEQRFLAVRP